MNAHATGYRLFVSSCLSLPAWGHQYISFTLFLVRGPLGGPGAASSTTAQVKVSNGILKNASADSVSVRGKKMADVAD